MTLQQRQQEHRQWLEGLKEKYPVQAEAALRLWDGLLLLLPNLQEPCGQVLDAEDADPFGLQLQWESGYWKAKDEIKVNVTVLQDGTVDWFGYNAKKKDKEFESPYTNSIADHIELLENYFTEVVQ